MVPLNFKDALTENNYKLVKSPVGFVYENLITGTYLFDPKESIEEAVNSLFDSMDTWRICCIRWVEQSWLHF